MSKFRLAETVRGVFCRMPDHAAIARAAWWVSVGLNVGVVVGDIAVRSYTVAALQSIAVAVLLAGRVYGRLLDTWFEARMAKAHVERQVAEQMLRMVQRDLRAAKIGIEIDQQRRTVKGVSLN